MEILTCIDIFNNQTEARKRDSEFLVNGCWAHDEILLYVVDGFFVLP